MYFAICHIFLREKDGFKGILSQFTICHYLTFFLIFNGRWGFFLKWPPATRASLWVLPSSRNTPWPTPLQWLIWEQRHCRQPGGAPEVCESRAGVWPCLLRHHASLPWILKCRRSHWQAFLFAWMSFKPKPALMCFKAMSGPVIHWNYLFLLSKRAGP